MLSLSLELRYNDIFESFSNDFYNVYAMENVVRGLKA